MEYLSTKEIAIKYDVNEETVRRWIRNKGLKAEDMGKGSGYKVSSDDLDIFLSKNKIKTKASPKEDKFNSGGHISISALQLDVPLVGGIAAKGLVSDIIKQQAKNGATGELLNIQIKKYELERRRIEIMALINSLNSELSLIEHELKTAGQISVELSQ